MKDKDPFQLLSLIAERGVRVITTPCDQCPFKGRLWIPKERLDEFMAECDREESTFICHKTLGKGTDVVRGEQASVCAGWLERARREDKLPMIIKVADQMDSYDRRTA